MHHSWIFPDSFFSVDLLTNIQSEQLPKTNNDKACVCVYIYIYKHCIKYTDRSYFRNLPIVLNKNKTFVRVEQEAYSHVSDRHNGAELRLGYQAGFSQQTLQEHFQRPG